MQPDVLFEQYRKTASVPMPRDPKFLEGMFVIRRTHGEPYAAAGLITKASASRQQFQVREYSNDSKVSWIAFAALLDDVILLHSSGDMWGIYTVMARNWQGERRAEKEAKREAADSARARTEKQEVVR